MKRDRKPTLGEYLNVVRKIPEAARIGLRAIWWDFVTKKRRTWNPS